MRLILATISFFISTAVLFGGYLWLMPPDAPGWLTALIVLIAILLSLIITNRLVNAPGTNFWRLTRAPDRNEQPDETSLIAETAYRASRCFRVEESDEEGPHYFIELQDKTVLYLNGVYLKGYEPHKTLGLINSARKFPCTEFIIQRDRYEGGVVGIKCRGTVVEPELDLPPFDASEAESITPLNDGDIVSSRTYEELKTARTGKPGS